MLRSQGSWSDVTICSVSGIIGVGKSTALRRLKESGYLQQIVDESIHVCIMLEPTDLWQANGWLEKFYADPIKRALSFQLIVFHTHVQRLQQIIDQARSDAPGKHILCLIERCMLDQLLFWKAQTLSDSMEDDAYMLIWRQWCHFIPPTKVIFYWTTSNLQLIMDRIQKRARSEETSGVSVAYQQLLMDRHEEWYSGEETKIAEQEEPIPCVQIDANLSYHEDDAALAKLAGLIKRGALG